MARKTNNRKTALLGVLGAQALALSFLENIFPALPGLPPGAKPGFSNIVTMFTAATAGLGEALAITVIKSVFAGVTRGLSAFIMSFAGGILSTFTMFFLLRLKSSPFGIAGVSVASAAAHNLGQLLAAAVLTGTSSVFGYAPVLLLFAVATGLVTGTVLKVLMPALRKQSRYFLK